MFNKKNITSKLSSTGKNIDSSISKVNKDLSKGVDYISKLNAERNQSLVFDDTLKSVSELKKDINQINKLVKNKKKSFSKQEKSTLKKIKQIESLGLSEELEKKAIKDFKSRPEFKNFNENSLKLKKIIDTLDYLLSQTIKDIEKDWKTDKLKVNSKINSLYNEFSKN